ncbi:hypothetical protein AS590_25895 [Prescottella equi]|nr:hypothetical protein AS590_25895 [Prescottella equi]
MGQKVRVKPDALDLTNVKGTPARGDIGTVISVKGSCIRVNGNTWIEWLRTHQLEPVVKSLDNLEVGDLIETEFGRTKMVIDVLPNSVALSAGDDLDVMDALWSIAEIKAKGWTVKQDTPTEEITELSIAELEKKLDLTAGTLRVKKD